MSSHTAQIIVVMPHPNSGGIMPDKSIYLSENGRPALIFKESDNKERVWIATLDNTIEDALLMVSNFVVKDEEAIASLKKIKALLVKIT